MGLPPAPSVGILESGIQRGGNPLYEADLQRLRNDGTTEPEGQEKWWMIRIILDFHALRCTLRADEPRDPEGVLVREVREDLDVQGRPPKALRKMQEPVLGQA